MITLSKQETIQIRHPVARQNAIASILYRITTRQTTVSILPYSSLHVFYLCIK
jgi:hypothetical protein